MLVEEYKADMNMKDKDENTFISILCGCGELETAQKLIKKYKKQINLNIPNVNGVYPIHLVCEFGEPEQVKTFIENGSNLNVLNKNELSPFHFAVLNQNFPVSQFLIDSFGFDVNAGRSAQGEMVVSSPTPLIACAQHGEHVSSKWLIDHGANVNIQTEDGYTYFLFYLFLFYFLLLLLF